VPPDELPALDGRELLLDGRELALEHAAVTIRAGTASAANSVLRALHRIGSSLEAARSELETDH